MPNRDGKSTRWLKNFGNSVKFSAVDVLKDLAPNTVDTASYGKDAMSSLVKELRAVRTGQNRIMSAMTDTSFARHAKEGFSNAVADLS